MRVFFWGGDKEIRTPDPLLAKQVLYQLSYTPELRMQKYDNFLNLQIFSKDFFFISRELMQESLFP